MKMKRRNILIFAAVAVLLVPFFAYGQDLNVLPSDPGITKGTLPNGVTYFLAANGTEKGLVEFALVQKTGKNTEDSLGRAVSIARNAAVELPRFKGRNSREFLAGNGFFASKNAPVTRAGMISVKDDATVYRFGAVPASRGETAVDSTLLMIFDIIEGASRKDDSYYQSYYPTSANAIIISGDINRDAMVKKLNLLSMLVPERPVSDDAVRPGYKWHPNDTAVCNVVEDSTARFCSISVRYSSPRTPEQYMNSVLPTVAERLGDILGTVVRKRLYSEMKRNNVPVARIGYRYIKSTEQSGDEKYEISVFTDRHNIHKAVQVMSSALSELDSKGTLPKEFMDARNSYLIKLYEQSSLKMVSNDEYIRKCMSSFLYGSDLATDTDKFHFFVRGKVADTTHARMFNKYASELIDSTVNLTINVRGDSVGMSCDRIIAVFDSCWRVKSREKAFTSYAVNQRDSMGMKTAAAKIKVKSTRKEAVSGGTLWTFENGMKVVYRRMNTNGLFYYSLMIRGGFSSMENIKKGEGAFLADMLETYDIGGLKSEDFHYLMLSNGVTMSSRVGISDMRLYGMAPRPSLTLLMKALQAVANERSLASQDFEYYRQCELIDLEARKGTLPDRIAIVDDMMCPSYNYSSVKSSWGLYADLPERAMKFFDDQFSRVNDGVFVIVGDMEETAMRKFLQAHLGGFRTMEYSAAKIKLPYQPISGWITHTAEGGKPSVDIAMSARMQFSSDSYMASKVAEIAIQDALNRALCGKGVSLRVASELLAYPQERLNVLISAENVDLMRMPSDEAREDMLHILAVIRMTLQDLAANPVSSGMIDSYKAMVENSIASSLNDPSYWLSVVTARFTDGKDLNTKYADKIRAVTPENVRDIIKSLNEGSKVEYIVR